MKHVLNSGIIVLLRLSVCCSDKQSPSKSGDSSEQQTELSNKQYSNDFSEAQLQLLPGVSLFSALGWEYRDNWDAIFIGRVPPADIEAGEEKMRQGEGVTLSSELRQAIALEHAERCHKSIVEFLDKTKNPPTAYAQAYGKLIEAYGAYESLYNVVIAPHGDKGAYKAAAEEEERKFQSLYAQVKALTPEERTPAEQQAAKERERAAEQDQKEWLAKEQEKMRQFKESVHKEGEARREVQAADDALEDLGRRDSAVAARNEASRRRVEEIMSGQAKGFEEFNGTQEEAQLIADKERLRDLKNAIQQRQQSREAPTPTATPPIEQTPAEAAAIVPTPVPQLPALFVTITKTVQKSPSGPRVPIPAGTKVQVISRGSNVVQVRYGGESVVVPIASTDLK